VKNIRAIHEHLLSKGYDVDTVRVVRGAVEVRLLSGDWKAAQLEAEAYTPTPEEESRAVTDLDFDATVKALSAAVSSLARGQPVPEWALADIDQAHGKVNSARNRGKPKPPKKPRTKAGRNG